MEFKQNTLERSVTTFSVTKTSKKMEEGTFEAILSTDDLDRHGEHVSIKGMDVPKDQVIKMYYNHETNGASLPIGKWVKVWKANGKLMGQGEIDMDDEFAVKIYKKIEKGMIDSISVGFYPLEYDGDNATWTKSTLVEASVVAEPANTRAVITSKELGFTAKEFEKSLEEKAKAENLVPVKRVNKGEVEDVLLEPKKWELMKPFWDVIYAFENAYYDAETEATEFNKLLGETIELLGRLKDGTLDLSDKKLGKDSAETTEIKAAFELLKSNYGSLEAAVKAADETPAINNIIKIRLAGKQVDKAVEALNTTLKVKLQETN